MVQVMDVLGYTEIPPYLILMRWRRDARDVLPTHLQIHQRDHAGSRRMTHRHTTLYVHAMELVRLAHASVEAYEKGMKLIREGITALAEYEDQRDGLGLEDRPASAGGAVANRGGDIPTADDGVQEMHVDTLAGLEAPEKRRKQGRPTNSCEKAPYEELSKRTRFCSICRGKAQRP